MEEKAKIEEELKQEEDQQKKEEQEKELQAQMEKEVRVTLSSVFCFNAVCIWSKILVISCEYSYSTYHVKIGFLTSFCHKNVSSWFQQREKVKVQAQEDAERQRQDRELQAQQEEEERQLRKKVIVKHIQFMMTASYLYCCLSI